MVEVNNVIVQLDEKWCILNECPVWRNVSVCLRHNCLFKGVDGNDATSSIEK
jgi:hypothetical protein